MLKTSAFVLAVGAAIAGAQSRDVENVAALARAYGAVRWFYPSDAAAALDWNRFAVYGVSRVRPARSATELETTLEQLFTALGPGIQVGASLPARRAAGSPDASLIAWRYQGPGFSNGPGNEYCARRTNRAMTAAQRHEGSRFGVMAQTIRADTLRGKRIRLRGRMRIGDPETEGTAGLWLRVDRTSRQPGFFDNMQNRPVRDTAWREYVIEGPIASDATIVAFGALGSGFISADIDAIELAVRSPDGAWIPLAIPDAGFEAPAGFWSQNGNGAPYTFTRPIGGAAEGQRFARIELVAGATRMSDAGAPATGLDIPVAGASADFDLARGLKARVPLALTDVEARTPGDSATLARLLLAIRAVADPRGRDDVDVRLADVVVAWSVFRHFYPYWSDLDVDWDARLAPQLATALDAAESREAHHDVVRSLVADLRDGHGSVSDVAGGSMAGIVPLALRVIGNQAVVSGSDDPDIPVGSVIGAVAGAPTSARLERAMSLASGTIQWRRARAERELLVCGASDDLKLTVELPSGASTDVTRTCERVRAPQESRPDSIAELAPGIWYVDLTRIRMEGLRPSLEKLAAARGVVFDARGYPTDAGFGILPYLVSSAEDDHWMHVPTIAGPFGDIARWSGFGWNVLPAAPHIAGRRVFLTDGRAISYAESVMGYIRDHKLATIVGSATAGANGNVAVFNVPGGFRIAFTGMRVTRHDGRTPFHTRGVDADVRVEPTLLGIRNRLDEVLARALTVLGAPIP
jgi:hypothetical protein